MGLRGSLSKISFSKINFFHANNWIAPKLEIFQMKKRRRMDE